MVKKTDTARVSDANANAASKDATSDSEETDVIIDNAKLTKAMATLVASIPSNRETAMVPEAPVSPAPARASATASPDPGNGQAFQSLSCLTKQSNLSLLHYFRLI